MVNSCNFVQLRLALLVTFLEIKEKFVQTKLEIDFYLL